MSIKQGDHKFKLTGFGDGRSTPHRISFWDDSLTGSSYRFDAYGNLVYFKAGSQIYYDIHYGMIVGTWRSPSRMNRGWRRQ